MGLKEKKRLVHFGVIIISYYWCIAHWELDSSLYRPSITTWTKFPWIFWYFQCPLHRRKLPCPRETKPLRSCLFESNLFNRAHETLSYTIFIISDQVNISWLKLPLNKYGACHNHWISHFFDILTAEVWRENYTNLYCQVGESRLIDTHGAGFWQEFADAQDIWQWVWESGSRYSSLFFSWTDVVKVQWRNQMRRAGRGSPSRESPAGVPRSEPVSPHLLLSKQRL